MAEARSRMIGGLMPDSSCKRRFFRRLSLSLCWAGWSWAFPLYQLISWAVCGPGALYKIEKGAFLPSSISSPLDFFIGRGPLRFYGRKRRWRLNSLPWFPAGSYACGGGPPGNAGGIGRICLQGSAQEYLTDDQVYCWPLAVFPGCRFC